METLDDNMVNPQTVDYKLTRADKQLIFRNITLCSIITLAIGGAIFYLIPFLYEFKLNISWGGSRSPKHDNTLFFIELILRFQITLYVPYAIFMYLTYRTALYKDYTWHYAGTFMLFSFSWILAFIANLVIVQDAETLGISYYVFLFAIVYLAVLALVYSLCSHRLWKKQTPIRLLIIILLPIIITFLHMPFLFPVLL